MTPLSVMHLSFRYLVVIGLSLVIYQIWNSEFEIPKDMRGWFAMTLLTPLVNLFINSNNIMNFFKKFICNYHTWNSRNHHDVIMWLNHYAVAKAIYKQESQTELAWSKYSHWWDTDTFSSRPQNREVPCGWCTIPYNESKLLIFTSIDRNTKNVTVYSWKKIDWQKFIDSDIRNSPFS